MLRDNGRTLYLDYLRIISTIAVVVIHVTLDDLISMPISSDWYILNVFNGLSRFAVSVFFMISGTLFLDPKRELSIKKLYTKNILRLLVAFFFWSFLYGLLHCEGSIKELIQATLFGHYHMWFIPAIIGLYVITPVLRKIAESRKIMRYYLIVAFGAYLLPLFIVTVLKAMGVSSLDFVAGAISDFTDSFSFQFVQGFAFYFILGYYLSTTDFSKKRRVFIYIMGAFGFLMIVVGTGVFSTLRGQFVEFYGNQDVPDIMAGVGLFVFAKYAIPKVKHSPKGVHFISECSKYTFGCYLMHDFVIYGYSECLHIDSCYYNPLLTVPLLTVGTFISCMLVSALLNHIPFLKKYIV